MESKRKVRDKQSKKRNGYNIEIKTAKRNDFSIKIEPKYSKDFFKNTEEMERSGSQVKKCSPLSVDDSNNYFISACDAKNTTLAQKWKSQPNYQSQSMFFLPVANDEFLKLIGTLRNKNMPNGMVGIGGVISCRMRHEC